MVTFGLSNQTFTFNHNLGNILSLHAYFSISRYALKLFACAKRFECNEDWQTKKNRIEFENILMVEYLLGLTSDKGYLGIFIFTLKMGILSVIISLFRIGSESNL